MTEHGVGALSMAGIARSLGVAPPSLYKYFDSLLAVYDALFRRGQRANLDVFRAATRDRSPGLPALTAALEATSRWAVQNPALAQLLFWRPVPGYQPSPEAFAPAVQLVDLLRGILTDAVAAGQVNPDAATDQALNLLSILHFGTISQQLANQPDTDWDIGRYTTFHHTLITLFIQAYPPAPQPSRRRGRRPTRR
jgi:AcrR family transcriptional regulator